MECIEALTHRFGVLLFDSRPVEPERIEQVLAAAIAAPSPANLQPWAFVVISDPRLTRQVAHYLVEVQDRNVFQDFLGIPEDETPRYMRLYEGFDETPCFIAICLQERARFVLPEHEAVLRDWYLMCLGAAMGNLMAAATSLGLGTRWFGGLSLDQNGQPLKDLLGVPDEVEIVAVTPLGYPADPQASKPRPPQELETLTSFHRGDSQALARLLRGKLPLTRVVHTNHWSPPASAQS